MKYIYLVLVELFVTAYFTFLIIVFQQDLTFVTVMDGVMVAGVVVLSFGWIVYLSNVGIYELIAFGLLRVKAIIKKEDFNISFYEYVYLREKNDAIAHRTILFTGFLFFAAGGILYLMHYTTFI